MASEFRKRLQNLFRRRSEDPEHSLTLDPEDITIGVDTVKVDSPSKRFLQRESFLQELSRENPLVHRLLRLKELTDIVAKQRVEEAKKTTTEIINNNNLPIVRCRIHLDCHKRSSATVQSIRNPINRLGIFGSIDKRTGKKEKNIDKDILDLLLFSTGNSAC